MINHAKVQRKVHESEDAACPSTLPHAFSVKERLQFVELGAHDEGDSHDPHGAWLAVAACRNNSQLKKKVRTWRPAHRSIGARRAVLAFQCLQSPRTSHSLALCVLLSGRLCTVVGPNATQGLPMHEGHVFQGAAQGTSTSGSTCRRSSCIPPSRARERRVLHGVGRAERMTKL